MSRAPFYARAAGPTTHEGTNTQKSKKQQARENSEEQPAADKNANTRALHKKKKHIAKKRRKEKSLWGAFVAQRETRVARGCKAAAALFYTLYMLQERENVTVRAAGDGIVEKLLQPASFMLLCMCALNLLLY